MESSPRLTSPIPPATPPPFQSHNDTHTTPMNNKSPSPQNSGSKDPKSAPPRSKEFYRVGPDFKRTCQNFQLTGPNGNQLYTVISARFDRGFQKTGPDSWLSYRRNYFTLTACFSLVERDNLAYGMVPPYPVYVSHGNITKRVESFAIRITALRVCNNGDTVELPLIQHTPKRDKGPREPPAIVPAVPGLLPDHNFMRENTLYRSHARLQKIEPFFYRSKSLLGPFCEKYPNEKVAHVVLYDRVQFTTAGGGGSQVCKAVVQLIVTLEDSVSYVVAWSETPPFTLRNRSPGNYYENGSLIPRPRKSTGSPGEIGKPRKSSQEYDEVKQEEVKIEGDIHFPPEKDFNFELLERARDISEKFQNEYRELDEESDEGPDDFNTLPLVNHDSVSKFTQFPTHSTHLKVAQPFTSSSERPSSLRWGQLKNTLGEQVMSLPVSSNIDVEPKSDESDDERRIQSQSRSSRGGGSKSFLATEYGNSTEGYKGVDKKGLKRSALRGRPRKETMGGEELSEVSGSKGKAQLNLNYDESDSRKRPRRIRNQVFKSSSTMASDSDSDEILLLPIVKTEPLDVSIEGNTEVTQEHSACSGVEIKNYNKDDDDEDEDDDDDDDGDYEESEEVMKRDLMRIRNSSMNTPSSAISNNNDGAGTYFGSTPFAFMAESTIGRARPSASRETHM